MFIVPDPDGFKPVKFFLNSQVDLFLSMQCLPQSKMAISKSIITFMGNMSVESLIL